MTTELEKGVIYKLIQTVDLQWKMVINRLYSLRFQVLSNATYSGILVPILNG